MKNNTYVTLDENNFVLTIITAPNPPSTRCVMVDSVDELQPGSYFEHGEFKNIGVRPSFNHTIDKINKCWIIPLDKAKEVHWQGIKEAKTSQLNSGYTWKNKVFDSDEASENALFKAYMVYKNQPDATVMWTLQNNQSVTLTSADLVELYEAMFDFKQRIHKKTQLIRSQIRAAKSEEDLKKITWESVPW